jgi:hypothetical protein
MVLDNCVFLANLHAHGIASAIIDFSVLIVFMLHASIKNLYHLEQLPTMIKIFILFDNRYILMSKSTTLTVYVVIVLSTFVVYYLQSDLRAASATITDPKDQLMPFDMNDMTGTGQAQNQTANNSSNIVADGSQNQKTPCEMPPCPPGQACIQSCP